MVYVGSSTSDLELRVLLLSACPSVVQISDVEINVTCTSATPEVVTSNSSQAKSCEQVGIVTIDLKYVGGKASVDYSKYGENIGLIFSYLVVVSAVFLPMYFRSMVPILIRWQAWLALVGYDDI